MKSAEVRIIHTSCVTLEFPLTRFSICNKIVLWIRTLNQVIGFGSDSSVTLIKIGLHDAIALISVLKANRVAMQNEISYTTVYAKFQQIHRIANIRHLSTLLAGCFSCKTNYNLWQYLVSWDISDFFTVRLFYCWQNQQCLYYICI